jgi:hypothetical protein
MHIFYFIPLNYLFYYYHHHFYQLLSSISVDGLNYFHCLHITQYIIYCILVYAYILLSTYNGHVVSLHWAYSSTYEIRNQILTTLELI